MRKLITAIAFVLIYFSSTAQIIYPRLETKSFQKPKSKIKLGTAKDTVLIALKKQHPELYKIIEKKIKDSTTNKYNNYRVAIEGLGNISSTQNGQGLNPSANVFIQMLPIRNDPKFKFYVGFNLGSELDSAKADSIKLASLFLPDRGKSGYIFRLEYNFMPLIKNLFNIIEHEATDDYVFNTELNPFIEYNFHKINIKGAIEDSSSIESSTWILGLNFSHEIKIKKDNKVGLIVQPFWKFLTITDGTVNVYRNLFSKTLNGESPQNVSFFGLSLGVQINRFQFSFVFEDLKTQSLTNTPLWGGVYTLRATVIGELIRL